MTDEASKTRAVRGPDFERLYLRGRVIDIGCDKDLVAPHAEPFDLEHGDAQRIAELRPVGAYDAVCSSHCLEHMRDVPAALRHRRRLIVQSTVSFSSSALRWTRPRAQPSRRSRSLSARAR